MKKSILGLLIVLASSLFLNIVKADECTSFYKVNVNIEGKGTLEIVDSDKTITSDTILNVKCDDSLVFKSNPQDGYVLKGIYYNGSSIASENDSYSISNIRSNTNIKVVFGQEEQKKDNIYYYSSSEDNISLYIKDLKEELNKDTKLEITVKEISILFDNEFLKNSPDNLTVIGNEIYKDDLNNKQKRVSNNSLYYIFQLKNGEKDINKIKGTAKIIIPYSKSKEVYVYSLAKDGKITLLNSKYNGEEVTFDTTTTGTFILSKEKLDELNYVRGIINENNKKILSIIGCVFALCLLIVFIKTKKRK